MITRERAESLGVITYDGKPCVNGHGTERYTKNSRCVECARARSAEYNKSHKYASRKRGYENGNAGNYFAKRYG
jgi:hypothetical protein